MALFKAPERSFLQTVGLQKREKTVLQKIGLQDKDDPSWIEEAPKVAGEVAVYVAKDAAKEFIKGLLK